MLAPAAWAQFTFTTNNGAITITGYTGSGGNVTIPSATNGYPVTVIGNSSFFLKSSVTGVTVGTNVTLIDNYAFELCRSLTNVIISDSVTNIGISAFEFCSNLMNVTIPDSVTSIGQWAFLGLGLTSVTIPNNVISIGNQAFASCYSMTNVAVTAGNLSYASAGGVLFNKALTTLIQYPAGLAGNYAIPDNVTSIGSAAFGNCSNLTSVTIPISVTNIGSSAFAHCGLTSVTIPNSVTSIGVDAFEYCPGLTNVTIGNSVISIGYSTFEQCNLTSVTIPNTVTNIGVYTFESCTNLHQAFFKGNAPSVDGGAGSADSTVFYGELGTVYYLTNTTGWGATFGNWHTVLWNPQVQTTNNNFGVRTNQFSFNLTGTASIPVVVEAWTNMGGAWTPLFSGSVTNGSVFFSDPQWTNYPQRFYRVRSP